MVDDSSSQQRLGRAAGFSILEQLEGQRLYLARIADRAWPGTLHRKVGPSDLVQDALARAVRANEQYSGASEQELRGWLKRILLNVILNEARRLRSQSRQTDRETPTDPRSFRDGGSSVSASLLRSELRDVLETALDRLKPEYAAVIRLRDFHEMEYAQIGEQLGKSAEAVRKVWNRAIAALQLELTNYVRDPR